MSISRVMGLSFVFLAGCGAAVPKELVNARSAYNRAAIAETSHLNPAGLNSAKQTLEVAEYSYREEGDSEETRDLAYTAERRTLAAEAHARELFAAQSKERALAAMHAEESNKVRQTSAELGQAKALLGAQGQELKNERDRRADADARAAQAMSALAGIANVKQEPRGMVITLSGSILFASNKADLLPGAHAKLDNVVEALGKQDQDAKMTVEGHADSQGAAAYNQELSQRRAESVRAYLVGKGIAPARVSAKGLGVDHPVADNKTAEGRANNRRVEIVVAPASAQ